MAENLPVNLSAGGGECGAVALLSKGPGGDMPVGVLAVLTSSGEQLPEVSGLDLADAPVPGNPVRS